MRMKRLSLCGLLLLSTLAGTAVAQAPASQSGIVRVPVVVSGLKGSFRPAGTPDDKWRNVEIRVASAAATGNLKAKAPKRYFAAKPR